VIGAINACFRVATGEYVLVTMVDLSENFSSINRILHLTEKMSCDLISASRYMRNGRSIGGSRVKRFFSRLAGISLHYIIRIPTHDKTNSFKVYKYTLLDSINITSTRGFVVGMEIKVLISGYKIQEVPTSF